MLTWQAEIGQRGNFRDLDGQVAPQLLAGSRSRSRLIASGTWAKPVFDQRKDEFYLSFLASFPRLLFIGGLIHGTYSGIGS